VVVVLLVGPGAGLVLSSVSAAARQQKQAAVRGGRDVLRGGPGNDVIYGGRGNDRIYGGGGVSPETWMHDLGGQLWSRKLSDIVIPGSHDTGTYALPDDPISLIGKAQTEDITDQLNAGIRDFDIRVKFSAGGPATGGNEPCASADYYAYHGILTACSLTLSDIFNQISTWANLPGHEQEIILVGLSVDQNHGPGPGDMCQAFGKALGSALLTPSDSRRPATAPTRVRSRWGSCGRCRVTPG
jgi:hypothetical protein